MQTIASLVVKDAGVLFERLKREGVPAELLLSTEESGVELGEIVVADEHYERACDVAEAWEAEVVEEMRKQSKTRCSKCGSYKLARVPHDKLEQIWQCEDCGHEFAQS